VLGQDKMVQRKIKTMVEGKESGPTDGNDIFRA
jgi:hypothetical protein